MILFQSQIEEHRKLADHYRELAESREAKAAELAALEQQVMGAIQTLNEIKQKLEADAIATLQSAVWGLLSDGGNDGGNKPTEPTPDTDSTGQTGPVVEADDDDDFELLCLNGETGEALTTDDLEDTKPQRLTYTQAIKNRCSACWGYEVATKDDVKSGLINRANLGFMEAVNLERTGREFYETVESYLNKLYYNGQVSQLEECPDSSRTGQYYELASPLVCLLWEDAPLLGQHCPVSFASPTPFVELVKVSDAIAYQRKHDGEILCCYVGFEKKPVAKSWMKFLEPMAAERIELRQAQRLESFKWELKIKGMSIGQIERLSKESIDKLHRPSIGSAKPPSYKPPVTPQPVNPDEVEEGDIVTTLYTPGGSYKVLKVMPDGVLDCQSLTTGTRFGLLVTNVSLVEKAEQPQPLVEKPQLRAKILLKDSEYFGQTLPVSRVSPNEMGYTVVLPNGENQWFRADLVQVLDAEIEEKALPSEPKEPEVIEFNDLVEVVADGNDAVGLVGAFGRVVVKGSRIGVEIDDQLAYFSPTELKVKAKAADEAAEAGMPRQLALATATGTAEGEYYDF